ncbi:MAG: pilus assembly protein N-terminal domain-containing protein [Pirellulales bacterium]|nr:pilus assembly protein N-terminal domain-containing protein [Pirellulales bacterium]
MRDLKNKLAKFSLRRRRTLLLAAICATVPAWVAGSVFADQPQTAAARILPPLPLHAATSTASVRTNPFCQPATENTKKPSQHQAPGNLTSQPRLKAIGAAVGLHPLNPGNPSIAKTPALIVETPVSPIRTNNLLKSRNLINQNLVDAPLDRVIQTGTKTTPADSSDDEAGSIVPIPPVSVPSRQGTGRVHMVNPVPQVAQAVVVQSQTAQAPERKPVVQLAVPPLPVGSTERQESAPAKLQETESSKQVSKPAGEPASEDEEPIFFSLSDAPESSPPPPAPAPATEPISAAKPISAPQAEPAKAGDRQPTNAFRPVPRIQMVPAPHETPSKSARSEAVVQAPVEWAPALKPVPRTKTLSENPSRPSQTEEARATATRQSQSSTISAVTAKPAVSPAASGPIVSLAPEIKPGSKSSVAPKSEDPAETIETPRAPAPSLVESTPPQKGDVASTGVVSRAKPLTIDASERPRAIQPPAEPQGQSRHVPALIQNTSAPKLGAAPVPAVSKIGVPVVPQVAAETTKQGEHDRSPVAKVIQRAEPSLHDQRYRSPVAVKQLPVVYQRSDDVAADQVSSAQVQPVQAPRLDRKVSQAIHPSRLTPLHMPHTQVRSLTLGGRVQRFEVADDSICQVISAGPNTLKLIGTGVGITQLVVWAEAEGDAAVRMRAFQVHVESVSASADPVMTGQTEALNQSIRRLFPDCKTKIYLHKGELVVTGQCDSEASAEKIIRTVRKTCLIPVRDQLQTP